MPDFGSAASGIGLVSSFMDDSGGSADAALGQQGVMAGMMAEAANTIFTDWRKNYRPLEIKAAQYAGKLMPEQYQAQRRGLVDVKQARERSKRLYRPIENAVIAEVGTDPAARIAAARGRATGAVDTQFDIAEADIARGDFTHGLAPDDSAESRRSNRIARAGARATAANDAGEVMRERDLREKSALVASDPGRAPFLPGAPTYTAPHSPSTVMNALSGASGAYGDIAGVYQGRADKAGAAFGKNLDVLVKKGDDISAWASNLFS